MPGVETSIDWGGSLTCTYRLGLVDPETWEVSSVLDGMLSAGVARNGSTRLLESGSIQASGSLDGETWGRIEVLARQGGMMERHAVATFLLVPADGEVRRGRTTVNADGYSVLKPAADMTMLAGSYVPAGADAAEHAASLLSACTPAPIEIGGSARLLDAVVFAAGTTYLDAAWMLVEAVGWTLQIDGRGVVHVLPRPTEPALTIDADGSRLLGTGVSVADGGNDAPNRYIAVDGALSVTATDDDPSSPTSTVSRGRFVDVYDGSPRRAAGESLQAYAERRLAELTETAGTRGYDRAWVPGLTVGDVVRGALPSARLDGDMRIVRQSLRFGYGITVTEDCEVLR